eukprot:162422_1
MGTKPQSTIIRIKKIYLFLAIQIFSIGYIYRVAFAPITDVLEDVLNTNATGLGLVSSVVYFGYASMQIPNGLTLQKVNGEFILFVCCIGLTITSFLFPLSPNPIIATIINTISGFFIAPSFVIHLNMTMQVLGNNYTSFMVGVTLLESYIITLGSTTLQAYVYQIYGNWKFIFYLVSALCAIIAIILFILMVYQYTIIDTQNENDISDSNLELTETNNKENRTDQTPLLYQNMNNKQSFCNTMIFLRKNNQDITGNINQITLTKALKASASNYRNYVIGFYGFGLITCMLSFNGLWLISYLMVKFEYSRELASFISSSFFVSTGISAVIFGRLAMKFKRRKPLMLSGAMLMTASTYIIYCDNNTSMYVIIIMNLISGVGCGAQAVLFSLIKEYNEFYNCTKCASGYVNTMVTCTGFVTQFLMGDLLDLHW